MVDDLYQFWYGLCVLVVVFVGVVVLGLFRS